MKKFYFIVLISVFLINSINITSQGQEQVDSNKLKKTLGFKDLKENTSIRVGEVTISFNRVFTGPEWNYDNYHLESMYMKAERGNIYVNAKITITSDSKDPNLPPISVYKLEGSNLNLLGTMGYAFKRWQDYDRYLGNYADHDNDFAYSKSIPFSCGLSIPQTDIDYNVVFVVVKKANCFERKQASLSNPPVYYSGLKCVDKSSLTIEDFDEDYILVKVFYKDKL